MELNLTNCQENAFLTFKQFLNGSVKENVMVLEGAAGTGKSTIITEYDKKKSNLFHIIYTAPTHKAKRVLEKMGKDKKLQNYFNKYQTLHKFFCMKVSYNKNGKAEFLIDLKKIKSNLSKIGNYKQVLVIIDEISMISPDLYNNIIIVASAFKNIKFVCIGDRCQLPPIFSILCKDDDDDIKEEELKSMNIEILSPFFTNNWKYHPKLKEGKRTGDKDIIELNRIFRQYTIHENTDSFKSMLLSFKKLNINSNIKIVTAKNHFMKEVYANIEKENAYVIAARNKTVSDYVESIRNKLYPDSIYPFSLGERIYITQYFPFDNSDKCTCGQWCNKNKLYTSEEMKIISANEREIYSDFFDRLYKVYEFEINYTLHNNKFLKVRKIHPSQIDDFKQDCARVKSKIKKTSSDNETWKKYHLKVKALNSPFTSSLAITAYKSQGSSYDYVFVDAVDIEECRRTTFLKSKELYTAITRPRKYICIYINLEEKYTEIPSGTRKCVRCRAWRNGHDFKLNKKGIFIKTCIICTAKAKQRRLLSMGSE